MARPIIGRIVFGPLSQLLGGWPQHFEVAIRRVSRRLACADFGKPMRDLIAEEWAICGSAWKRDPGSGVIGVEKGPLIPLV